ncbi:MAG: DUF4831 family protein [Bacteroidales bacterium]|nr:DUF4831 family protein [Bacteroidales bacterium]
MKKKTILALFITLCTSTLFAQSYRTYTLADAKQVHNGIIYSVPQTEIVVKVQVEKTTRTKGIYNDKAYLLGLDNSALKNSTSYSIKNISIEPRAVASSANQYYLTYSGKTSIDISENGILRSITVAGTQKIKNTTTENEPRVNKQRQQENKTQNAPTTTPTFETELISQGLLSSYPLMTAEKAVAEIKALRQKQIDILSGAVEGTYLNTTVDYMYKQLDEIIKTYVSLFTGIATTEQEEYIFSFIPQKPIIVEEDLLVPLFKFSQENGISDLNSKSEDSKVMARIHSFNTTSSANETFSEQMTNKDFKNKTAKAGIGLYYAIPEQVKINLEMTNKTLASKVLKLAQYGTIAILEDGTNNVVFDENTGAILKLWN